MLKFCFYLFYSGDEFRSEYDTIVNLRAILCNVNILLLTAAATGEIVGNIFNKFYMTADEFHHVAAVPNR